jgi:FkbM family methyltransferase
MDARELLERTRHRAQVRVDGVRAQRMLPTAPLPNLVTIGDTTYGGQILPDDVLTPDSVCYLIGVGEDITFDLSIIARYGVTVHAFDPVPRAGAFVEVAAKYEPRMVFRPYAVWSHDEELTFYAPFRPGFVSQSAVNMHGRAADFVAQGRSISSIMEELGHDHLDFVKVSAEGAEFAILDHLLDSPHRPLVVCSEFSQPTDLGRLGDLTRRFAGNGYRIVAKVIQPGGWKVTWYRG